MELIYVVLGLLVLYLFMKKCGCRRVEGLEKGECCDLGTNECNCSGWGVYDFGFTGKPECDFRGFGTCQ